MRRRRYYDPGSNPFPRKPVGQGSVVSRTAPKGDGRDELRVQRAQERRSRRSAKRRSSV